MKYLSKNIIFLFFILLLSGCQMFIDNRKEPLLVVTASQWAEMETKIKGHLENERLKNIPKPIPGSDKITFSNTSDAYLAGCRSLGIIEVQHYGSYNETITILRNQAFEMKASVIVPIDTYQEKKAPNQNKNQLNFVKGRMLRCPSKNNSEEL